MTSTLAAGVVRAYIILAFLFTIFLSLSIAQTQSGALSKTEQRRRDYPQQYSVVDLAQAAPAELRALALLRLGSQTSIRDNEWREELLEEAFEAGGVAHLAFPVIAALAPNGPMSESDRRRMPRTMAINAGVDRLTLQSAALRALAPLNMAKALSLFERSPAPKVDPTPCPAPSVPNTEQYFQTAAVIAGLNPAKKREEIVTAAIISLSSSVQVAPALRLLKDVRLSPREHQRSLIALANVAERLPQDSRAWAAGLNSVTEQMSGAIDASGPEDRIILLRAWRTYLMAGLSGSVCAEVMDPQRQYDTWAKEGVQAFNQRAANISNMRGISDEESQREKIDSGIPEERVADYPKLKELQQSWFSLMFGKGGVGLSDRQKSTAEWKAEFSGYLNKVNELTSGDIEDGQDLMWHKAQRISASITAAPKGSTESEQAMERHLGLVRISNIMPEDVWKWYSAVQDWIRACNALSIPRRDLLAKLDNSGYPWLKLLSKIEGLRQVE